MFFVPIFLSATAPAGLAIGVETIFSRGGPLLRAATSAWLGNGLREAAMNINGRTGAAFGLACSLLLSAAGAAAADDEDPYERQREAAEKRYEMAKESCGRLEGEDGKRCEEKAKDVHARELETLRQEPSPAPTNMGTMPGGEDPDGIGAEQNRE